MKGIIRTGGSLFSVQKPKKQLCRVVLAGNTEANVEIKTENSSWKVVAVANPSGGFINSP